MGEGHMACLSPYTTAARLRRGEGKSTGSTVTASFTPPMWFSCDWPSQNCMESSQRKALTILDNLRTNQPLDGFGCSYQYYVNYKQPLHLLFCVFHTCQRVVSSRSAALEVLRRKMWMLMISFRFISFSNALLRHFSHKHKNRAQSPCVS